MKSSALISALILTVDRSVEHSAVCEQLIFSKDDLNLALSITFRAGRVNQVVLLAHREVTTN
jgi:hypothetical protein